MRNCSFSTADSIKLATVVECDAEDNFALAFTLVCGCAAIPRFLSDCSPCSLIPIAEEFWTMPLGMHKIFGTVNIS